MPVFFPAPYSVISCWQLEISHHGEYLHYGNQQMQQIRTFLPREPVVIYQHISGCYGYVPTSGKEGCGWYLSK